MERMENPSTEADAELTRVRAELDARHGDIARLEQQLEAVAADTERWKTQTIAGPTAPVSSWLILLLVGLLVGGAVSVLYIFLAGGRLHP
ncbi:hypothetical protein HRD49_04560 [Corallococcus exiguus]|uniref:hypothetical protein n=1 Tax=Corallococcus TaxID=83461 RepID=UPI000EA0D864|nr:MULTISPECIES: hypothetical protein [Corallococcus]NRD61015.1 hypothetical protein [Corallococcus exiguus]RKH26680.1 hypothetical protein D7V77_13955 [Corallococcus sp. CA041A]RKI17825.1 hypothetical protein D7Y15_09800 [Corallococcus sp. AB030]